MERQQVLADELKSRTIGGMMKARQNPTNWVELVNQGATRNLAIADELRTGITSAIEAAYGPGYKARVYSGGQPALGSGGRRVGSTRHDDGMAADLYVYDPQGTRVTGDGLAPLARYWLANSKGGVGLEMRGGGIHLDAHRDRPPFWTYGPITAAQRAAVQEGLAARGQGGVTATAYAPEAPRVASAPPMVKTTPITPDQAAALGMDQNDMVQHNRTSVMVPRRAPTAADQVDAIAKAAPGAPLAPVQGPPMPPQSGDRVALADGRAGALSHGGLGIADGDMTGRYTPVADAGSRNPDFLAALAQFLRFG
jgi:hypothetical protein